MPPSCCLQRGVDGVDGVDGVGGVGGDVGWCSSVGCVCIVEGTVRAVCVSTCSGAALGVRTAHGGSRARVDAYARRASGIRTFAVHGKLCRRVELKSRHADVVDTARVRNVGGGSRVTISPVA